MPRQCGRSRTAGSNVLAYPHSDVVSNTFGGDWLAAQGSTLRARDKPQKG
jgi:hypothetical protein